VLHGGIVVLTLWGQHLEVALRHCSVLTLGGLQKHSVKHGIKIPGKNLVWVQGKLPEFWTEVYGRWKCLPQERQSATPSCRSLG